jgi:hypothetical protein
MRERAYRAYWREISTVLLVKAVAIGILYGLFFAPGGRPALTAESVATHLDTQSGQDGGQK